MTAESDNDERFTRADWRPSKRGRMRKRLNPYAGRKHAPAAFLEAAKRTQFVKGLANHRKCRSLKRNGQPCGNLALKGLPVCGCHGGFGIWAKQGKLQPSGRAAAAKAVERLKASNPQSRAAPAELTRLPQYQNATQWDRIRMIKAWGSQAFPALAKQANLRGSCV